MKYDVIIVGAGPAGLFTAYELIEKNDKLKVLLIDQDIKDAISSNVRKDKLRHLVYNEKN